MIRFPGAFAPGYPPLPLRGSRNARDSKAITIASRSCDSARSGLAGCRRAGRADSRPASAGVGKARGGTEAERPPLPFPGPTDCAGQARELCPYLPGGLSLAPRPASPQDQDVPGKGGGTPRRARGMPYSSIRSSSRCPHGPQKPRGGLGGPGGGGGTPSPDRWTPPRGDSSCAAGRLAGFEGAWEVAEGRTRRDGEARKCGPFQGIALPSEGWAIPSLYLRSPCEGLVIPCGGKDIPQEGLRRPCGGSGNPSEGLDDPREGKCWPREGSGGPSEGLGFPREGSGIPSADSRPPSEPDAQREQT